MHARPSRPFMLCCVSPLRISYHAEPDWLLVTTRYGNKSTARLQFNNHYLYTLCDIYIYIYVSIIIKSLKQLTCCIHVTSSCLHMRVPIAYETEISLLEDQLWFNWWTRPWKPKKSPSKQPIIFLFFLGPFFLSRRLSFLFFHMNLLWGAVLWRAEIEMKEGEMGLDRMVDGGIEQERGREGGGAERAEK